MSDMYTFSHNITENPSNQNWTWCKSRLKYIFDNFPLWKRLMYTTTQLIQVITLKQIYKRIFNVKFIIKNFKYRINQRTHNKPCWGNLSIGGIRLEGSCLIITNHQPSVFLSSFFWTICSLYSLMAIIIILPFNNLCFYENAHRVPACSVALNLMKN